MIVRRNSLNIRHIIPRFSGPQGPLTVCLHLKMEFRSCARGRQWCGIFHYHWWTASIKPRLLFSHSGLVSWGLPFLQFIISLLTYISVKWRLSGISAIRRSIGWFHKHCKWCVGKQNVLWIKWITSPAVNWFIVKSLTYYSIIITLASLRPEFTLWESSNKFVL